MVSGTHRKNTVQIPNKDTQKTVVTFSGKDLCIPSPCKNEGHCETHGFTFECHCTLGYKGKHCEGRITYSKLMQV